MTYTHRIPPYRIEIHDELTITVTGTVIGARPPGYLLETDDGQQVWLGGELLDVASIIKLLPAITEPEMVGVLIEAIDPAITSTENDLDWYQWISVEPITQAHRWYRVGSHAQERLTAWADFVATRLPGASEPD